MREAGQESVAPLGGEVWTVPETGNKAKQAKAAEFVECISSDENQLALAEARFTVPTKTALAGEYVSRVPEMASFTEQVATARSRTGKLGEAWPEAATVIYDAIQLALTGKASPAERLQTGLGGVTAMNRTQDVQGTTAEGGVGVTSGTSPRAGSGRRRTGARGNERRRAPAAGR